MEKEPILKDDQLVIAYHQGSSPEMVTVKEAMDRHMFIIEEVKEEEED